MLIYISRMDLGWVRSKYQYSHYLSHLYIFKLEKTQTRTQTHSTPIFPIKSERVLTSTHKYEFIVIPTHKSQLGGKKYNETL
jgi:hypothetical protein